MSQKLETYLRTYRLKSGLTQKDIAYLLSIDSNSAISRIERCHRIPGTSVLLGYCLIFKVLPGDLAPGLLLDIENAVINRALVLKKRLKKRKGDPLVIQRIKFLEELGSSEGFVRTMRNEKCNQGGVTQIGLSH